MSSLSSETRRFALGVVHRLRKAGHEALLAGGCVRDYLLGLEPQDYDVATSATPDEVRRIFGRRHTVAVGAAFGVIIVLEPKEAGQVEVATFRRDAAYSDGRHPDSVTFSSPAEDARRRDFTINGLFYDPVAERVIDHVGGQQDLQQRVIRAIGDPYERIAEDKLRMLRAVRFTVKFDFQLDRQTFRACADNAAQIAQVSSERIADEMRKTLVLPNRVRAVRLLLITGLLAHILPESGSLGTTKPSPPDESVGVSEAWQRVLAILDQLHEPEFPLVLAAILRCIDAAPSSKGQLVETVCRRWRLSLDEIRRTVYLVEHEGRIRCASREPWPQLQRLLITDGIEPLLELAAAVAAVLDGSTEEIAYCREKLMLPSEKLNPPPLITGDDLIAADLPPGKAFRTILDAVRDAQLLDQIRDRSQALELARQLWRDSQP